MTYQFTSALSQVQPLLQRFSAVLFLLLAITLAGATALAALGLLPWLQLGASIGGMPMENAGQIAQVFFTILMISLCFYLPSSFRIMQLENSHRRFAIDMNDITRAYTIAHAADREDAFSLSSEFDAVRERLVFLSTHPDLEGLEPDLLEVAAQMSHVSRDLAAIYSEARVTRARTFLKRRQEEITAFNARLDRARLITQELKQWIHVLDIEEGIATSRLRRLRDDLNDVLPELDHDPPEPTHGTIVAIPKTAAE